MAKAATKDQRHQMSRERLLRLKRLRSFDAPKWVIKAEQIAMFLNRKGLKNSGIGSSQGKKQIELYERHVLPLLNK